MSSNIRVFCALLLLSCACAGNPSDGGEVDGINDSFVVPTGAADAWGIADGSPEALGALRAANELSPDQLLNDARLSSQATDAIVDARVGVDGDIGTGDDVVIGSLTELDAIPYVGPIALSRLVGYATAQGWVTSGTTDVIEPLADSALARITIVLPEVNGKLVQTDVTLRGGAMAEQHTANTHVFDVDPAVNSCVVLNGTFSKCFSYLSAGRVEVIHLAAAYIADLSEVGEVNVGQPNEFKVELQGYESSGAETFDAVKNPGGGYRAWFPGVYTWTASQQWLNPDHKPRFDDPNKPLFELRDGEITSESVIPGDDFRAIIWRVGDPASLPDARPSSFKVSFYDPEDEYAGVYGYPDVTLPDFPAAGPGRDRVADPILFFRRHYQTGERLYLNIKPGPCPFSENISYYNPITYRARRVEVKDVTVNDPAAPGGKRTIKGTYSITRYQEVVGRTDCSVSFETGTGVDVPPGHYVVTVRSNPVGGTVTTEHDLDLK